MGVTVSNLVLGPARLYYAPFGAAEPLDSSVTPNGVTTPPGSPWVDVGGTDGGVNFTVEGTLQALQVDQIVMEVGARLTDLKMSLQTKLSEVTLTNFTTALNGATTTGSGTGYSTLDVTVTSAATQPTYLALIMDGFAPYLNTGAPALRRCIIRKVLATPKISLTGDRKTQQSYDLTWSCYYVSNSINPIHIIDQQA